MKRIITTILILALSLSIFVPMVEASSDNIEVEYISSYNDEQIEKFNFVESFKSFQGNIKLGDKEKIIGMITSLLIGKTQAENLYEDIDFESVLNTNAKGVNESVKYFLQRIELFKRMRSNFGLKMHDNTLEYTFSSINIDKTFATVKLSEFYQFLQGDSDIYSKIITQYSFDLVKTKDGSWQITNFYSDFYRDRYYQFKTIDLDKELALMTNSNGYEEKIEFGPTEANFDSATANSASSGRTVDYTMNATRVINYVNLYYDNYNTLFSYYSGADCQNYASQCILAGLGFTMNATSVANKVPPCDTSGSYQWYPGSSSFIGTQSFVNYLMYNTGYDETGLFGGIVNTTNTNIQTAVGNIIELTGSGTPPSSYYGHATVVVTAGTNRSNTNVSAHSSSYRSISVAWLCGNDPIKICEIGGYATCW